MLQLEHEIFFSLNMQNYYALTWEIAVTRI